MDVYSLAKQYALQTNQCIYITGKAGTGKTTFLRQLRETCAKQMAVVAATGVAAINAEGVTIHSLFQLPPRTFIPTDKERRKMFAEMQMRSAKRKLLANLELLVIDEISMVRADLLDAIDAVLRHVKHYPNLPFGGVQVIFIGDLFQLSPVVREDDWIQLRDYYEGPYFFQAHVMKQIQPVYLEFDHIFRQQNADFIAILNQVRDNKLTPEGLQLLDSRYQPNYQQKDDKDYHIILSTHNQKVNAINERELAKLGGKEHAYRASIRGTFPENTYPADETLVLKEGARVMFIKNDSSPAKAYYNGKLGVIHSLSNNEIIVESEGQQITVGMEEWENVHYVPNPETETIDTKVVGTFAQIPLRLAWAVTIHKAQGLTFDYVVIDAIDAFAAGQVYVALSRCRTLEGIVLLSKIPNHALGGDNAVIQYTNNQPSIQQMEEKLPYAQVEYVTSIFCHLFDFREIYYTTERIRAIFQHTKILAIQGSSFVNERMNEIVSIQSIGETFQTQLKQIITAKTLDFTFLQKRLQAAYAFFAPRLQTFMEEWQNFSIEITDKEDKKDYNEYLTNLLVNLLLKLHIMKQVQEEPTLKAYFNARTTFQVPANMRIGKSNVKNIQCDHPELLAKLDRLRGKIAKEANTTTDKVFRITVLTTIANQLPTVKGKLAELKGLSRQKINIYGSQILEIVRAYCQEKGLPIEEEPVAKAKEKSAFISLQMHHNGKSIAQIAKERDLSKSTIAGHLYGFIKEGVISIDALSEAEQKEIQYYLARFKKR